MWTRPREASRAAAEEAAEEGEEEEEEEEEEADDNDDAAETAVGVCAGGAAAAPAAARGTSEPAALVAAWPILTYLDIREERGAAVCVCVQRFVRTSIADADREEERECE